MSDLRVASRYARALFGVALKGNETEAVESDLDGLANLIDTKPEFKNFLHSPRVGRDEKLKIMESIFSNRVTATTMKAIRLLLEKRRETLIPEVRDRYVELRREQGNVIYAQISSASALADGDQAQIVEKLAKGTGKRVDPEFVVDSSLIGGVKIAYGNYVLDGTIRGGLRRMRDTLRYELLKQA